MMGLGVLWSVPMDVWTPSQESDEDCVKSLTPDWAVEPNISVAACCRFRPGSVLLLLGRFQCSERPLDVLLRLFSTLSSRMESCWSCEGSGSRLRLREPEAKGSRLCSTASAGKSTVSRSSEASASLASAASSCRRGLSGSSFDCARCAARLTTACRPSFRRRPAAP